MTILISASKAIALSSAGTSNNPIIGWDNLGYSATATTDVGTEQTEGPAVNATTGSTYDAWIAQEDTGEAALQLAFGSAQSIGFAAIAAHNIGTLGATVEVQYSTDSGASWTTVASGDTSPADDQAIAWYFDAVSSDYWRLLVTDLAADDVVSVGVFFVGNALTMGQRIYQGYTPPLTPTEVDLQSNVSEGGHLLGS